VGSGCGYQTAILSLLIPEVFSIERLAALHQKAKRHLAELRITNVRLRHDDGYRGWPAAAPFDAILVTAAPPEVPEALLKQLADGGRLILPVGGGNEQELRVITRNGNQFHHQVLERVVFVPMLTGIDI
jgi:protein-L-isoaspartate(D-aspartate) O-methyltransferase